MASPHHPIMRLFSAAHSNRAQSRSFPGESSNSRLLSRRTARHGRNHFPRRQVLRGFSCNEQLIINNHNAVKSSHKFAHAEIYRQIRPLPVTLLKSHKESVTMRNMIVLTEISTDEYPLTIGPLTADEAAYVIHRNIIYMSEKSGSGIETPSVGGRYNDPPHFHWRDEIDFWVERLQYVFQDEHIYVRLRSLTEFIQYRPISSDNSKNSVKLTTQ